MVSFFKVDTFGHCNPLQYYYLPSSGDWVRSFDQIHVVIVADHPFPTIPLEIFHELRVLLSKVHPRQIGYEEVCHQDTENTTDRGYNERPSEQHKCGSVTELPWLQHTSILTSFLCYLGWEVNTCVPTTAPALLNADREVMLFAGM